VKDVDDQLTDLLMTVPNFPCLRSGGQGRKLQRGISRWGEPPVMDFEPKWHDELGRDLGILDFESGVKIAGARFTVLKGLALAWNEPWPTIF
jgi:seryl-tRNA synthetase